MVNDINSKAVSILMRGQIPTQDPTSVRQAAPEQKTDYSKYRTRKEDTEGLSAPGEGRGGQTTPRPPTKVGANPGGKEGGRKEPSPCGSGKEYKKRHRRET